MTVSPISRSEPDPGLVLDLLEAFRRSKTMFAAVSLGVFDALEDGPLTLDEIAAQRGASVDGMERLLDACVGLQLLRRCDGRYANSPAAATYLTQSSPRRLTGYINYSNDVMWRLWQHLEDAVREGTNRWNQVYGWDGAIFSHFFKTEESKREFLMGMHGFGLLSSPLVVSAFDLSRFRRLVDLGGATGHLAVAACRHYADLRAVVFDLPEVVPLTRAVVAAAGLLDRIEICAGDFFGDELPEGDVYALGRIIHDWTEQKIDRLLRRVFERLSQGGAVLIAEKVLSDDKSGPRWAQMQNLNMLTCTEGKERTPAEYEQILSRIGFSAVRCARTTAPLDAILAVK